MRRLCLLILLNIVLLPVIFSQQPTSRRATSYYTVKGQVIDAETGKGIRGSRLRVALIVGNKKILSPTPDMEGLFQMQLYKPTPFQVMVSSTEYYTYTTPVTSVQAGTFNYNVGIIRLRKINSDIKPDTTSKPTPVKVANIETTHFVQQKLMSNHYLPTKGAYDLYYALNPELRGKTEVPSNYTIRYPQLPNFRKTKRLFKKRFKKDKKRNEPYVYVWNWHQNQHVENEPVLANSGQHRWPTLCAKEDLPDNRKRYFFFGGKSKKFVFVFYKRDSNGQPYYLESRYTVFYYADDVKGHEELYNKTANATFGYAPMKAHIYNVEVYDQAQNNKRVNISDGRIDPYHFFQVNELFNKWIKIAIQVYD
jgi:hypothetical protein